MKYRFTLKFRYVTWTLTGVRNACGRVSEALEADGTVDSTGMLWFCFQREGDCACTVMREALHKVLRALPGAALAEASPDYVGLSDVGKYLGITRQCVRKWLVSRAGGFPSPVHDVNGMVWHLAEVLEWMQVVGRFRVDPELLEVARSAAQMNLRVDASRIRLMHGQSKANPEIRVPSTSSE